MASFLITALIPALHLLLDSLKKLNPLHYRDQPVLLLTEMGAVACAIWLLGTPREASPSWSFSAHLTLWLWLTLLFANAAESLAEKRGKAQASSLKKMRTLVPARLLQDNGEEKQISSGELKLGDRILCQAGDLIPADGEVIEGIASVNESAITGESAPVIREAGGDRSAVTGGTLILSDRIVVRITTEPGKTFLDQMIQLVEGAKRQKTPQEKSLGLLLTALTLLFVGVTSTLKVFLDTSFDFFPSALPHFHTLPVLMALLICLIPTTIGGLLNAIGISGMDRLIRKNVIATSGRAVEAAGDIDVLLLDKTGTITLGNRMAHVFFPLPGVSQERLAQAAYLSSLADETPEGKSILQWTQQRFGFSQKQSDSPESEWISFTAQTRLSGVNWAENGKKTVIRKGAEDRIQEKILASGKRLPPELPQLIAEVSQKGGTPLVVMEDDEALGVIFLKDIVKSGMKERFAQLRKMGIRSIMITGDNPMTAAAIAAEAGVDDFLAKATPEQKLERIRWEQQKGHLVAMTGDGTNDAPALAQADVGVAMNAGTQPAKEAANMIDLESNPTKLIEIVEVGKQLLMTRGALTTFSLSNDVAKYFAILPALFLGLYAPPGETQGPLAVLNIMRLHSPQTALLSAVMFNALILIVLIPLALKGVPYRPEPASVTLKRNLLLYGLGGLLCPFIGIKLFDELLTFLHLFEP